MVETSSPLVPSAWIDVAAAEHRRLIAGLADSATAGTLDVGAPSLLPDWTVGHVITHITHSGDGHVRMLDAAAIGEFGHQYPGGMNERVAGIEAGARRPAGEQIADLQRSIDALEVRWATMPTWAGTAGSIRSDVLVVDLPFLRIREVAVHHADLGIGSTFADLPPIYLREELGRMEMLWMARQPMGMTKLPTAVLDLAPPDRLAWLMGRVEIDGIEPAGIY